MKEENGFTLPRIPDFVFDICPGLHVTGAFVTDQEISMDESIFSNSQCILIDRMLNAEIERLQTAHAEQLESAKKTAWQNGNQAGVKQTTNQLLGNVQEVIEQLRQLMDNVTLNVDLFMEHYEQEVLKLIVKIARKVIEVEVGMNPDTILDTLRKGLEYLSEKEEIHILVNPDDWAKVNDNIKKLALSISMPENIEVLSNEKIEAGGCKIEFKAGSIDAEIDTQFAEIKRKLLKDV